MPKGTVTTIVIVIILAAIAVFAVLSYVKKLRSGCCGSSDEKVRRSRVADWNKSHYPTAWCWPWTAWPAETAPPGWKTP